MSEELEEHVLKSVDGEDSFLQDEQIVLRAFFHDLVEGARLILLDYVALGLEDVGLWNFDGFGILGVLGWWLWGLWNFAVFFHFVLGDAEE